MAHKNRKQATQLELEARFGNYEAWTSETYSEVRGSNGHVVKRIKGATSASEAVAEASALGRVLALV
jgi:hypothetical protein